MRAVLPLSLLAALSAAPLAPAEADPLSIVLRSFAAAPAPFVLLADVADLPQEGHPLRNRTADLFLGFTPEPGSWREIRAEEIAARVREAGLAASWFRLEGAPSVWVVAGPRPEKPPVSGTGRK